MDKHKRQLQNLRNAAEAALDADAEYWTDAACGQDTQEAEASGILAGQVAGLDAALAILNGEGIHTAAGQLDLTIEQEGATA